ncbi:MAG: flagellar hook assembly protein FlgD, partial [Candidatus Krumholzibacteriia bacterium]
FGSSGTTAPSAVLPTARFAASNYPNPFNPSTKISYTIKAAGHLSLKVYNVRGQLVKTLVDGNVSESGFVTWDGKNNQGTNVSSGVYFYEARMGNDVEVNKMALVK